MRALFMRDTSAPVWNAFPAVSAVRDAAGEAVGTEQRVSGQPGGAAGFVCNMPEQTISVLHK